jgi:hypothetical protein
VFIFFRLFRLVFFLVLIIAVLGLAAFVLGRPFVERLAARSIEDRIGTAVSVSIDTSISPGSVRGDLGSVTVRAKQFERNGLKLAGARAIYRGTHVELSDLISRKVRLTYSSVGFQGTLSEGALAAFLRPLLAAQGVPAKNLRVAITRGRATLHLGKQSAAFRAKIVGRSSIEFVPLGGAQPLARALQSPIQLGPLPDGVHLTAITLRKNRATIGGKGDAGVLKA